MSASAPYIAIGADFDLWYEGAQLRAGGPYLNAGACTWALRAAGSSTGLATGSLAYTAASNGNYLGYIPAATTAGLTADADYDVVLTFTSGGITDARTLTFKARKRGRT